MAVAKHPEEVRPAHPRELEVDERDVERSMAQELERVFAAARAHDLVAIVAEHNLQRAHDVRVVVDHQDSAHAPRSNSAGNRIRKLVPAPGTLAASMLP